ncbi:MAG: FtsK/SpoIIIE domain-containing protein [Actinomycetota bacterium]|nr:FtsK/SpoIIIE domain-containing protein [Actinomycetota bacterium]
MGRDPSCDIRFRDPSLSRRHAEILVGPRGVAVRDLGSSNGSAVEDVPLEANAEAAVPEGAHVRLGRTVVRFSRADAPPPTASPRDGTIRFNRPPRVVRPYEAPEFTLKPPPAAQSGVPLQLGAVIVPLVLGLVLAVVFEQPAMLLFAVLSPATLLWTYLSDRRSGRRNRLRTRRGHAERVEELETELAAAHAREVDARRSAAPDTATLVDIALRTGSDLWARRSADLDFLSLRVGAADQPAQVSVAVSAGAEPDARTRAMLARYGTVPLVPSVAELAAAGSLGIAGPRRRVDALGRSLALQAAVLHSPRELAMAAAFAPGGRESWEWLKWLPHTRSGPSQLGGALAGQTAAAGELVERIAEVVQNRQRDRAERYGAAERPDPALLVFMAGDAALPRPLVAQILTLGPEVGVYCIWLGGARHELPGECGALAVFDGDIDSLTLVDVRAGSETAGVVADGLERRIAEQAARALAPVTDAGAAGSAADLPARVSLFDVLGAESLTAASVRGRWRESMRSVDAPIGVSSEGTIRLDLRADGPHALVAGTTGAGKSELLQALVAALAVTHPPRSVTFLLIDYKGGAAFQACARLPHTVGVVTDLDGGLAERTLASLNAELRRREAHLRDAGARDLAEIERRAPGQALPSLVIVIDEFATLTTEVPAFVDGVVDIARRGRSLGLHLILATQRPAGVVTEQVRANTNLRIALRVASRTDSEDVIAAADAARIARTTPGRALLRTGPGELVEFQSAYAAAPVARGDSEAIEVRPFGWDADSTADVASARSGRPERTQLDEVVDAVAAAADEEGIEPPPPPWLPVLPELLPLEHLPVDVAGDAGRAVIGLIDEPERQRQHRLALDFEEDGHVLVFGTSGSGKTTLLRTVAAALARAAPPDAVHVYGLDCAGRGLDTLKALPHCGAVVSIGDTERVIRLVARLRKEIEQRKRTFAKAGASTLGQYAAREGGPRAPRIFLLLDDYAGFVSAFERIEGGLLVDSLARVVAEGRAAGVHVVATADRRAAVPTTVLGLVARRLVLRMAAEDDYVALGVRARMRGCRELPPGRGLADADHEFQAAVPGSTGDDHADALAAIARRWAGAGGGPAPIEVLRARVSRSELPPAAGELSAHIGLTDELEPAAVSFAERHFVIAGPYRSGRTSALETVVVALRESTPGLESYAVLPRRNSLRELGGWAGVADAAEADALAAEMARTATAREPGTTDRPLLVVVDDAAELEGSRAATALETVVRRGRDVGVRVLCAVEVQAARVAYAGWLRELRKESHGLLLQPDLDLDGDVFGARLPRRTDVPLVPGRGYLIAPGGPALVQVALA